MLWSIFQNRERKIVNDVKGGFVMALSRNQIEGALKLFARGYIALTEESERRELCRDFIDTFKLDIVDIKEEMKSALIRNNVSQRLLDEYDAVINYTRERDFLANCVISDLSLEDEKQIVRLITQEIDIMPHFSEYDVGTVKDFMNTGYSFTVKSDDEVVGVVLADKHMEFGSYTIYLNIIAVNDAVQGRGVGRMMMEHLKKLARANGIVRIQLYTKKYLKAYEIYRHMGFAENDERDGVYMTGFVF